MPRGLTVKPKVTSANGKQTWVFDIGKLPPTPRREPLLTPDAQPQPEVMMSAVTSWAVLARDYAKLVDKAIADGAVTLSPKLPKAATVEAVRAIVQSVTSTVTYRAMGFYLTSMAPSLPAEVEKRGNGDSKDLSILVVALLRQAGVRADLALVDGGSGPDVERDAPAIDVFDTVLVRAIVGGKPIWIDVEEMYAAPGQLGSYVQGRRALVISADTTDLITTPMATSADNTMREERTFNLLEVGNGDVTEVLHAGGVYEMDQRDWMAGSPSEIRKGLTSYVSDELDATFVDYKSTAPQDLSVPLTVTITSSRSGRAYTSRDRIDVELRPFDAFDRLPDLFTDDRPADATPRASELWNNRPHRHIVESRMVVPPGFKLPTPAAPRRRTLGAMTFTATQKLDGRTFVVTYDLDTGPPRMKAKDVIATQDAIDALYKEGSEHFIFENIGASLLIAGKVKESITEFERVAKLHPTEAVHQDELARAYLAAGAGEAARRTARKAVSLEPKNADAYVVLGWVLGHDELGRRFTGAFDRAGAKAALEKARTLDPKHVGVGTELGQLLERDAMGRKFEPTADLVGAAAGYKASYALDADDETAFNQARALLWAGKGADAEAVLKPMKRSDTRDMLYMAAIALGHGAPEAVRTASTMGADRAKLLAGGGSILFLLRSYDSARALFTESGPTALNKQQTDMFTKLKKIDIKAKPIKTPADAVIELVLTQLAPERGGKVFWDNTVETDVMEASERNLGRSLKNRDAMTIGFLADISLAMMNTKNEGDDKAWRIVLDAGTQKTTVFLAADHGVPKVLGVDQAMEGVGRHVLRLLAKDDEATSMRVLDWLESDLSPIRGTLAGTLFRSVWGGKVARNRAAMELAAAVIAGDSLPDRVIAIVDRCPSSTTDGQFACDLVLANALRKQKRWADLDTHAQAWMGRSKVGSLAQGMRASALVQLGKLDDAEQVLADVLANDPDNSLAIMGQAEILIVRGKLGEAVKRMLPLENKQSALDLNNLAWLELTEHSNLAAAKAHAEKAVQLAPDSPDALHTLACIEAELGELGTAWDHAQQSMALGHDAGHMDGIYYLHGRVLEMLGFKDEAIAAYKKVKPNATKASGFPDSNTFAAQRLKALGAKP